MVVTGEQSTEICTLSVDEIGKVLSLPVSERRDIPGTLDSKWRNFAEYIFHLEDELMAVLDIDKLLRH